MPLNSILSVRARPLWVASDVGVDGMCLAVFGSDLESTFSLRATPDQATSLRAHGGEVDLSATVERNEAGVIWGGTLESFEPVLEGDAIAAWCEWGKDALAQMPEEERP